MADIQTVVWSVIGAGGGGAVVGISVFKALGAKWLDTYFANRSQALKHEHDQEMAHLKLRIDGQLDRATKLNQREFEIIPELWRKTTDAHFAVLSMISVWQQSPDLSSYSDAQFEEFLSKSRLDEWQKGEIRQKNIWDRTTYYSDLARWHRLHDATEAITAFNRSLLGNSVFLHPETNSRFEEFAKSMRKAFNRWRVNMQMGDEFRGEEKEEPDNPVIIYRDTGDIAYEGLAAYLRERFWVA